MGSSGVVVTGGGGVVVMVMGVVLANQRRPQQAQQIRISRVRVQRLPADPFGHYRVAPAQEGRGAVKGRFGCVVFVFVHVT